MVHTTDNVAEIGKQAVLPCNTTPAVPEDNVVLVVWYREDKGIPIYSLREIIDVAGPYNEDTSVSLMCEAKGGRPSPRVIWWKDSNLIDDTYFSKEQFTINRLIIRSLKAEDLISVWSCKASTSKSMLPIVKSIKLDINLKPKEIKISRSKQSLTVGTASELVCQTRGSKPPAKLQWLLDQTVLEHSVESISMNGFVTTNYLTYVPTIEDNKKRLACIARNPSFENISLEDGFILDIKYAPVVSLVIGANSGAEEISQGAAVFFQCNIQANPKARETWWTFNGRPILADFVTRIDGNSLLIANVSLIHKGDFQCFARNELGTGESEAVFLNIQHSPICKNDGRQYLGIARNKEALVTCKVDSTSPLLNFFWTFESIDGQLSELQNFESQGTSSVLRFVAKSQEDFGVVYCRAQNSFGFQSIPCSFFLYPEGPPDPPENCSLSNISSNQLTVECLPGYNGGLNQIFHLEVTIAHSHQLLANLTSLNPLFKVNALPTDKLLLLTIYSSNLKGVSDKLTIRTNTLASARWQNESSSSETSFPNQRIGNLPSKQAIADECPDVIPFETELNIDKTEEIDLSETEMLRLFRSSNFTDAANSFSEANCAQTSLLVVNDDEKRMHFVHANNPYVKKVRQTCE
ncbi:Nephrin-like protein [Dinothrombium tinctorium]|uniref:Nephrin-like protein n=1 Tax=Dinothrombium tinctorium TaxID=1965070 RepID=A0A3S3P818_9ACAR|nr:Nephrin-like protein [Dinothrombium tinctorium]